MASEETWLTRAELAERWKMPVSTLAQWAHYRRGPKFARFGRHCRYPMSGVLEFEASRVQSGGDAA